MTKEGVDGRRHHGHFDLCRAVEDSDVVYLNLLRFVPLLALDSQLQF